MSKPTKKFIVTSSQMVEVVKTWEITDSNNHIPVEDIEIEWTIKEQENDQ